MVFITKRKTNTDGTWKQCFALFPTRVGLLPEGKTVWVWFGFYLARQDYDNFLNERKPLVQIQDLSPYKSTLNFEAY